MITSSDFLHLPYTRDLTEGGIAYAVRSLAYTYNRMGGSPYERLRRIVAGVAVELAFRRYLSEQDIPFDVMGATPFTDPDHYDVSLGGRRCDIKSFLITYREQISKMKCNPDIVLQAPALVPSDQHAGAERSEYDLYLFAFLPGLVAACHDDLRKVIAARQPHYLIHAMPQSWARPSVWNPLGRLALKSESAQTRIVELGGQDERREMLTRLVEIPPQTRIEIEDGFFSLSYIHVKSLPDGQIGIYSPTRKEIHMIGGMDWGNIWVYGMGTLFAGYLTRAEFSRRASPIQAGARIFQYDRTRAKNLAVPAADLKPLSELFERVREHNAQ
jgi:hypothetical protein